MTRLDRLGRSLRDLANIALHVDSHYPKGSYNTNVHGAPLRHRGGGSSDQRQLHLSIYVAAKHGVIGLTKSAASEFAADRIRVNAVAPHIETDMTKDAMVRMRRDRRAVEVEAHAPDDARLSGPWSSQGSSGGGGRCPSTK